MASTNLSPLVVLLGSVAVGLAVGIGSIATSPAGRATIGAHAQGIAVATGFKRVREPQPGDHWGGCNDARAAGTEPIYRGEPGYREEMDGDNDGIACEPYR